MSPDDVAFTLAFASGTHGGHHQQKVIARPPIAFSVKDHGADAGPISPTAFSIMPMNSGKDYKARETDIAQPIMAGGPVGGNQGGDYVVQPATAFSANFVSPGRKVREEDAAGALTEDCLRPTQGNEALMIVQPAVAFDARQSDVIQYGEKTGPLDTDGLTMGVLQPVALYDDPRRFDARGIHGGFEHGELHPPLNTVNSQQFLQQSSVVRRLTPRECERLQGFPDDYTLVSYRKKPAADGPRYKALGNSMAVPCMRWLGERIDMVERIRPQTSTQQNALPGE